MSPNHPATHDFLLELIRRTQGSPAAAVSMYEVGAALGLEKTPAGKLAEEVIAQGWAEIKTLSGAIGVTAEGLRAAGPSAVHTGERAMAVMGSGPVLRDEERRVTEQLLELIQEDIKERSMPYPDLEEIVLDLKTARVQLLSPKPKTAILKEILRSLWKNMDRTGAGDIAARIAQFIAG